MLVFWEKPWSVPSFPSPDNQKIDQHKSPAGKTDYHTMGACYEVLKVVD